MADEGASRAEAEAELLCGCGRAMGCGSRCGRLGVRVGKEVDLERRLSRRGRGSEAHAWDGEGAEYGVGGGEGA